MPESPTWFEDFKKANQSPTASPAAAPGTAARGGERRRHARFEVDGIRVNLTADGILSVFGVGRQNKALAAVDLSEGGVRLVTTERIPPGTKVRVRLEIEKYKDAIEAAGEVRWSFQGGKKNSDFYAGIMFVKLDAGQVKKITLMREWFQSPQYRALKVAKARQERETGGLSFPK